MPFAHKPVVIFAGILLVALCGVAAFLRSSSPEYRFNSALQGVADCLERGKNLVPCSEPFVRAMLSLKDSANVMQALSRRFELPQCHAIGHLIGRELYRSDKSVESALRRCDHSCDSSCPHGVIATAFADKLGLDDPNFDLGHMSEDAIQKIGRELCSDTQTCHGVGHALFQAYASIEPALAMCGNVAEGLMKPLCYSGVYMEYGDDLTARNMRPVPEVAFPDPDTLSTFCTAEESLSERRTCFLYFPRIVRAALGTDAEGALTRMHEICESYKGDERGACFSGLGTGSTFLLEQDPAAARAACEQYTNLAEQAQCNLGIISIDPEDREPVLFPFCASLSSDSLRAVCYQGVFSRLGRMGDSVEDAAANYCKEEICYDSAKKYAIDPWTEIKAVFGE